MLCDWSWSEIDLWKKEFFVQADGEWFVRVTSPSQVMNHFKSFFMPTLVSFSVKNWGMMKQSDQSEKIPVAYGNERVKNVKYSKKKSPNLHLKWNFAADLKYY